ncbi:MAG: hypothetical protein ACI9LM_003745 [Alteromonadaceae bacterium]|jgi:hypothetical protein
MAVDAFKLGKAYMNMVRDTTEVLENNIHIASKETVITDLSKGLWAENKDKKGIIIYSPIVGSILYNKFIDKLAHTEVYVSIVTKHFESLDLITYMAMNTVADESSRIKIQKYLEGWLKINLRPLYATYVTALVSKPQSTSKRGFVSLVFRYLLCETNTICKKFSILKRSDFTVKYEGEKTVYRHNDIVENGYLGSLSLISVLDEKGLDNNKSTGFKVEKEDQEIRETTTDFKEDITKIKDIDSGSVKAVITSLLIEIVKNVRGIMDDQYFAIFDAECDLQSMQWQLKKNANRMSLLFNDVTVGQDEDKNIGIKVGTGVGIAGGIAVLGGPIGLVIASFVILAGISAGMAAMNIYITKEKIKVGDKQLNNIMLKWLPHERLIMDNRITALLTDLKREAAWLQPSASIRRELESLVDTIKDTKIENMEPVTMVPEDLEGEILNRVIGQSIMQK